MGSTTDQEKFFMNAATKTNSTQIFWRDSASLEILNNSTIAVIGYGNQGRAQALNLRDSGIRVIVGNRVDAYRTSAQEDGFKVFSITDAIRKAEIILLLIPDEVLPQIYEKHIRPNLKPNAALVFASGYNIAFNLIDTHPSADYILIAPRMIGVGVRERYLTQEGFYCLVGIHQDASGQAQELLLALTLGISGFYKPAIQVTFKQEAILDLFNEQAFGPAFGQVLLNAISVLVKNGIPPEAALVEMYLSEEMAYTYKKMAQVGLVRQTLFHSQTSQYGAMSRGIRFSGMKLRDRMERIYAEIASGDFAREWGNPLSQLKLKVIRFFAMRQNINRLELNVRKSLGLKELQIDTLPDGLDDILTNPSLQAELAAFKDLYDF